MKNKNTARFSIGYRLERPFCVPVPRALTPHEFWHLLVGLAKVPVLHQRDWHRLELALARRK